VRWSRGRSFRDRAVVLMSSSLQARMIRTWHIYLLGKKAEEKMDGPGFSTLWQTLVRAVVLARACLTTDFQWRFFNVWRCCRSAADVRKEPLTMVEDEVLVACGSRSLRSKCRRQRHEVSTEWRSLFFICRREKEHVMASTPFALSNHGVHIAKMPHFALRESRLNGAAERGVDEVLSTF
jgi:hypothetical protein